MDVETIANEVEHGVEVISRIDGKMTVLTSIRATEQEPAHFVIAIYDSPTADRPSAVTKIPVEQMADIRPRAQGSYEALGLAPLPVA